LTERYGERVFKVSLRGGFTCPNRDGRVGTSGCAFCAGDALEPAGYRPGSSVAEQLRAGIDYIRKRHGVRRFVAYFQDYTATYGEPEHLARVYEPALGVPQVVGLAIGTRPDCLPAPVLDLLASLAERTDLWIEIGLQVANDDLLGAIGRGHTVADFERAVADCHARGLPVCAHVIVGLPGAGPADEERTADLLSDLEVWGVKIHAFHVLRGTRMATELAAGRIPVLSLEGYVERAVSFLERLRAETVVHRVTGEAPRRFTLAPEWTINKLAVHNAVLDGLSRRDTWQGRLRGAAVPGDWCRTTGRETGGSCTTSAATSC
jgi:radical SAM protein (TIGR01212 family)